MRLSNFAQRFAGDREARQGSESPVVHVPSNDFGLVFTAQLWLPEVAAYVFVVQQVRHS